MIILHPLGKVQREVAIGQSDPPHPQGDSKTTSKGKVLMN